MRNTLFILATLITVSLVACSKKSDEHRVGPINFNTSINIIYTRNGAPLFGDSSENYDTVHKITAFSITPNSNLAVDSFLYDGLKYKSYIFYINATAFATDTVKVGIKWSKLQVDTLENIIQNNNGNYSLIKCLYNGVVKLAVNVDSLRGFGGLGSSLPAPSWVIKVEK